MRFTKMQTGMFLGLLLVGCGSAQPSEPIIDNPPSPPKKRILDPNCTNPVAAVEFKEERAKYAMSAVMCLTKAASTVKVTEHLCNKSFGITGDVPYIEFRVTDQAAGPYALTYIYAYVGSQLAASWALHTNTAQPCSPRDGRTPIEVAEWLNRPTEGTWGCTQWYSIEPETSWCLPK